VIEFRAEKKRTLLHDPRFAMVEIESEVRYDPLAGESARIAISSIRLRRLPHSRGKSPRRGRQGLLLDHAQLPERAHRPRRPGDGRGAKGARARDRLHAQPPGVRALRCGTSRRSASASRCFRRKSPPSGRSCITPPGLTPRRGLREGSLHGGGLLRRAGERSRIRLPAVPSRARLHRRVAIDRMCRDARVHSIGGGATAVMLEEVAKRL
jgi:hypothetical protein